MPNSEQSTSLKAATAGYHVAFFIPDLGGGGAERVVVNLVNHYVENDVPITLVLARAEGALLDRLDSRVAVVDLKVPVKALAVVALARYLRRARPDCLVSHMDIANVAACAAQRLSGYAAGRLILCCHLMFSKQLEAVRRPKDRVVAALMRRLYPLADQYIAVSHGVAEDIATVAGVPLERFAVIHNPAYDDSIPAQAAVEPNHLWLSRETADIPVVITAGRLTYEKDFSILLAAIEHIRRTRPVRLIVLGTGPLEAKLKQQTHMLGIAEDVDFVGFQPNPFSYISRANVFALTSRWEGFGNVLVEAMACGTPVVSTDCPAGPVEILQYSRAGYLAPVGDAIGIANQLMACFDAPPDKKKLYWASRLFSVDKAAGNYWRAIAPE